MPKVIVIKLVCVLLILAGLNVVYNLFFYEKDLLEKSSEILRIRELADSADLYYFGESSNITYAVNDTTAKSISGMTNDLFPSLSIKNINKYATHGGIYKHWLKEIDPSGKHPAAVIITLNLRSFNADWRNSELETALQESLVLTQPYPNLVNRFLLSLQAFDNKTPQQRQQDVLNEWQTKPLRFPFPFKYKTTAEWDLAMANGTYLKPDGSWDMEKIKLACHYIKSYSFNLDEENARVKDFDAILDWCTRNKMNLYLNLMAENMDFADSLVGKELVFLMRQNRDFLVKRYSKEYCTVVDNLELVRGGNFIDKDWTTEHYTGRGRMQIARNLADSLKKQFNNAYKSFN